MSMLDIDFSILLDNVTIARSRKHITKYYDTSEIGKFPARRKPISYYCDIAQKEDTLEYKDIDIILTTYLNKFDRGDSIEEYYASLKKEKEEAAAKTSKKAAKGSEGETKEADITIDSSKRTISDINIQRKKYEKIFKGDPEIHQKTDNQGLYIYSLMSYSENGYVLSDITFDLHKDKEDIITTEYEDKFSSKGMPIYSVVATKSVQKSK